MTDPTTDPIPPIILRHYPAVQGIYLFGSYGTEDEWPDSDVDLALLLPPAEAKAAKSLALSPCRFELEDALAKEVDLLNARQPVGQVRRQVFSVLLFFAP